MPTLIYTYGAKPPHIGADLVAAQISAAHRYYNALVEIERERRVSIEESRRRHFPLVASLEQDHAALTAEIDAIYETIRRRNATERRKSGTKEERDRVAALKAQRREVAARLSLEKQAAFDVPPELAELRQRLKSEYAALPAGRRSKDQPPELIAQQARLDQQEQALRDRNPFLRALAEIEQRAAERVKSARKNSGLYWGTYLAVEDAVNTHGKELPRFKRWDGSGKVCVQFQGGLTVARLFSGDDTRAQIDPLPDDAHSTRRATTKRTNVRLRIGSDGREPIWCEFRVTLHRPLPEGAVLKWAYLIRERIAQKNHWRLSLVIDTEAQHADQAGEGRVGVDVGWRLTDAGLRVAYWCGADGDEGELVIPVDQLRRWKRPREIRSRRDVNFDALSLEARDWLRGRELSPALIEASAGITHWRGHGRLSRLLTAIAAEYPDEPLVTRLTAWDRQDRKDWKEEAHTARKFAAWRDDLYRNFAAMLRRRYRTIAIEQVRWQSLQRVPTADAPSRDGALTEYMRAASPYRLQQLLAETASVVDRIPAKDTTSKCSGCGLPMGEPDRAALYHTCRECGETIDQDRNAALNLLRAKTGSARN